MDEQSGKKMKIERIPNDLATYKNIAYINGTKNFPLCVGSAILCCFVETKKLDVKFISVDNDLTLIHELKENGGEIPAFYYEGKLIASGEKLKHLIKSGAK